MLGFVLRRATGDMLMTLCPAVICAAANSGLGFGAQGMDVELSVEFTSRTSRAVLPIATNRTWIELVVGIN